MFSPVSSKVSFPQLEEKILAQWKANRVFERSIENREGKPRFVLYEGPPTANGNPGIHHVLSRVFKDIIPRYKTMKGFYAPRIAGWDTHGLPVELEVEKRLGFSGKTQIEEYGIAKFNEQCRESVFKYLKQWNELTERIAFWVDQEHPYITMDNNYIETCWWAIKQMWDRALVYQGYRVTPHCPRCGTSLSSHEVALGYKDDTEDPSVYIKFKVVDSSIKSGSPLAGLISGKTAYLLAWTTTPWTLPGNVALAVSPAADYSVVEAGDEYLILADALRSRAALEPNRVLGTVKGSDLAALHYEPLYKVPITYAKGDKKAYRVITGDFVTMEEGTGIVHIAPAYGEIDFEVGQKENLPLIHSVDLAGKVQSEASGVTPKAMREGGAKAATKVELPGAGQFVKKADLLIMEDLKSRGLLFNSGTVHHTYPFCWRCDTPLLYYAKQTWYIKTTAVKERLIAGNAEINWYPDYIKYGRFGDWLENNVDWAFSRERYWGTPLPVWRCPSCGNLECVGGLDDLSGKPGFSGFKQPLDLHRPHIDEITFNCGKCGAAMKRVPEVIDCWFDSGAMPIAQYHYPFENQTLLDDGRFPADFICEAVDQTRGWFYSLHAIATLLFGRNSYRNVICLGHILDAKGEKMSKARGNVVEPWKVINKHGADALRWFFYTSSPAGNVRRFDEAQVADVTRRFVLILWNVYSFFVTYANIDNFVPGAEGALASELDRWILSELNQLIRDVDSALNGYDPTEAGRKIEAFVDELSSWYVRRSRRRFWKSESDTDKLSAYNALYQCLVTLTKLLAPFMPFLAEELYQNLVRTVSPQAPDSVHLADFPVADESKIDQRLSENIRLVMKVASLGRAARSQAGIKVRQPLAKVMVNVGSKQERVEMERLVSQVLDELNVKELGFVESATELEKPYYVVCSEGTCAVAVLTEIPPELVAEGIAREVVHRLQTMRRESGFDIADHIATYYEGDAYVKQVMQDFANYVKQETLSIELVHGVPPEGVASGKFKIGGHEVILGVRRLTT